MNASSPTRLKLSLWDVVLPSLGAGVFLVLMLRGWSGHDSLHPDDAEFLAPAWGFLTQNADLLANAVWRESMGFKIPYMVHRYHGPYEIYLSLPFLFVWKNTTMAAFARSAFFGVLAAAGVYALARRLYQERLSAFFACLLWASSVDSILGARFGILCGTSVICMGLFALERLLKWLEEDDAAALLTACALLGLGLFTRTWFIAMIVACAGCAVVRRQAVAAAWARTREGRPALAFLCAGAFLIWGAPALIGNMLDGWNTVTFFAERLGLGGRTEPPPSAALGLGRTLGLRLDGLIEVLNNGFPTATLLGSSRPPVLVWQMPLLALAAVLVHSLHALLRRRGSSQPVAGAELALLLIAFYFPLTVLSPTNLCANHLYPALPLIYIAIAGLPLLARRRHRAAAWAALFAVGAVVTAANVRHLAWIRGHVSLTGGAGMESSRTIHDLTRWLLERGIRRPYVISNGAVASTLAYLSGGEVLVDRSYWHWGIDRASPQEPERLRARLAETTVQAPRHFIVASGAHMGTPSFVEFARRSGKSPRLMQRFSDGLGVPVYEVYEVGK